LLRDFEAMRDRGGRSEEIGRALLAQAHQMFTPDFDSCKYI
jgi:hypothetical protein